MNRRLFVLLIVVLLIGLGKGVAAAQNSYALWFANYWDNVDMAGAPIATSSTGVIDFDWGSGSPSGVPSDKWSGQWTAEVDFEPGTYRFYTQNDDGVRVFLGYRHIITDWNEGAARTNEAIVSLTGGSYPMAVDFFDKYGRALLKLGWERTGPPQAGAADVTIIPVAPSPPPPPPAPQSTWLANYWNNMDLSGSPALTQDEATIDYDWGTGSPAPGVINADHFSASWLRAVYFNAGAYRFTAQSDDGMRVSINGNTIINNWTLHPIQTNTADVNLAAGTYSVFVEYFENTGDAVAKLSWQAIPATESSPGGVTATVYSGRLNMREGPSTTYMIMTKLPWGTIVPVVGRTTDSAWLQVNYQGASGWIWAAYTSVNGDLNSVPVTG